MVASGVASGPRVPRALTQPPLPRTTNLSGDTPMWTRRQFFRSSCGALLTAAGGARLLPGADRETLPDGGAAKGMITPVAQQAIDQGLSYLSRYQRPDGSYGTGQYQGNVAITSL